LSKDVAKQFILIGSAQTGVNEEDFEVRKDWN
jgi:hypothetical protein